jgi:hypothetical protein
VVEYFRNPDHQIQKSVEEAGLSQRRYQQKDSETFRQLLSGFTWLVGLSFSFNHRIAGRLCMVIRSQPWL